MNTAVINIKTEKATKIEAQKVAENLGFNLSSVLRAYLKEFIRTKRVNFSLEEPSDYLISTMKKAEEDRKKGKASPIFRDSKSAIKWLEKQGI